MLAILGVFWSFCTPCMSDQDTQVLPKLGEITLDKEAISVSSLEDLYWLSCKGTSATGFLYRYDWRALTSKREEIARSLSELSATEAFLPYVFLTASGVKVEDAVAARILCARLDDFEVIDEWSIHFMEEKDQVDQVLGKLLTSCGKAAIPYLMPLLKKRVAVYYSSALGTEAYMFAERDKLRTCDLAAKYLSQILGTPWELDLDLAVRDRRIDQLTEIAKVRK